MTTGSGGLGEAFTLILRGDAELLRILWLSLWVTGLATAVAMLLGVPAGVFLALRRFPGRGLFVTLVNAGMGLPPVVVGLFVFLLLCRSGPLGSLGLLYTPTAMLVAQVIVATPVVVGVAMAAIQGLDELLIRDLPTPTTSPGPTIPSALAGSRGPI